MKKLMIGAVCAMMAAVTFAANVEITNVTQTPGSGKATVNYTVSGLSTKTDLAIKAIANGKSTATTITGVANGAGSVEIDYKSALGIAPNVAFSAVLTDPDTEGVQLWKDGPYWATCNVGASKPEDFGYYFWWGDTVGYRWLNSNWEAVASSTTIQFAYTREPANNTYNKSTDELKTAGYLDSNGTLVSSCDAATAYLGAPWRMPTKTELDQLVANCTTTWTTRNGVYGCLVTGKNDYESKSIFLPAAGRGEGAKFNLAGSIGYYVASTPLATSTANILVFYSSSFSVSENYRYYGQSIRPVRGFAK